MVADVMKIYGLVHVAEALYVSDLSPSDARKMLDHCLCPSCFLFLICRV